MPLACAQALLSRDVRTSAGELLQPAAAASAAEASSVLDESVDALQSKAGELSAAGQVGEQ